jgi:hypothetical protein
LSSLMEVKDWTFELRKRSTSEAQGLHRELAFEEVQSKAAARRTEIGCEAFLAGRAGH